jgi:hypothetical protein
VTKTVTKTVTKDEKLAAKYHLVDKVGEWLVKKDASYIACDGLIVFYSSLTGRLSDFRWYKLSLPEVVRVVNATELQADTLLPLKPEHVLTACQELERVYEMSCSSPHAVSDHIFNFLDHEHNDLAMQVMQALARTLFSKGYKAFRRVCMTDIYLKLNVALSLGASPNKIADLYWPVFTAQGYEIRSRENRVQLEGRKQAVIMLGGLLPRHVEYIPEAEKDAIYYDIYNAFK